MRKITYICDICGEENNDDLDSNDVMPDEWSLLFLDKNRIHICEECTKKLRLYFSLET